VFAVIVAAVLPIVTDVAFNRLVPVIVKLLPGQPVTALKVVIVGGDTEVTLTK
jgi:hypothetical protein